MIKNQGKGFIAVRFGNVMGSRGSVIPIWQNQIDRGKPITVTDKKMMRYFMSIPEAVELVIEASIRGIGGEIFILDMGQQVNILKLAKEVLNKAGGGKIKIIGLRPGETLDEKLMTLEEEKVAKKIGKFFVIK